MDLASFEVWAERVSLPWPAIRVHLQHAVEQARAVWPELLQELSMYEPHKAIIRHHWQLFSRDFRLLDA